MSSALKKARLNTANGDDGGNPSETSVLPDSAQGARPAEVAARGGIDIAEDDSRLRLLRESMAKRRISGYLVETQDAHQSEYVSDHDKRREWITGFTGSAGTALVTATEALMWTDGRYFLQAIQQLRSGWTLMRIGETGVPTMEQWLAQAATAFRDAEIAAAAAIAKATSTDGNTGNNTDSHGGTEHGGGSGGGVEARKAPAGETEACGKSDGGGGGFQLGVDPWLVSTGTARSLIGKLAESGGGLVTISGNLVDEIWTEQPPVPQQPVRVHPLKYAGVAVADKLTAVRSMLLESRASSLVVMAMDEVAWLFNIRGSDISFNPVAFAGALVTQEDAFLFIDEKKLGDDVLQHLQAAGVTVRPYEAILGDLRQLKPPPASTDGTLAPATKVMMAPSLNLAVRDAVPASLVLERASPIALAKALKNDKELQGLREAHVRDGVALTSFLSWLERAMAAGDTGGGGGMGWPLTEFTVAEKLDQFRREQAGYVSLSFETISGYGPNGAIIHYAAQQESALALGTDSLFLLDSGAQYEDGTTDITRTVHFGEPTPHQRYCFTLVLKGHIALARAVFPEDTMGSKLDVLARLALWEAGLDYRHGTGHGVGAFLNVHEGPHGIHCRIRANEQGIKVGMTTSNEPGYYEDGEFGLRIENVCICVEKDTRHNFAGKRSCTFDTITMAPIQAKLIDVGMLTEPELEWLNAYHATVLATLGPLLQGRDEEAYAYLVRETRSLGQA